MSNTDKKHHHGRNHSRSHGSRSINWRSALPKSVDIPPIVSEVYNKVLAEAIMGVFNMLPISKLGERITKVMEAIVNTYRESTGGTSGLISLPTGYGKSLGTSTWLTNHYLKKHGITNVPLVIVSQPTISASNNLANQLTKLIRDKLAEHMVAELNDSIPNHQQVIETFLNKEMEDKGWIASTEAGSKKTTTPNKTMVTFGTAGHFNYLLANANSALIQSKKPLHLPKCFIFDEAHAADQDTKLMIHLLNMLRQKNGGKLPFDFLVSSATIAVPLMLKQFNDMDFEVLDDAPKLIHSIKVIHESVSSYNHMQRMVQKIIQNRQSYGHIANGNLLVFFATQQNCEVARDWVHKNYRDIKALVIHGGMTIEDSEDLDAMMNDPNPMSGRYIVFATERAETSITLPISWVVDTAYSMVVIQVGIYRKRLVEKVISKFQSIQRRGRCGRLCEGLYICLVNEDRLQPGGRESQWDTVLPFEQVLKWIVWFGNIEKAPFDYLNLGDRLQIILEELNYMGFINTVGTISVTTDGEMAMRLHMDMQIGVYVIGLIKAFKNGDITALEFLATEFFLSLTDNFHMLFFHKGERKNSAIRARKVIKQVLDFSEEMQGHKSTRMNGESAHQWDELMCQLMNTDDFEIIAHRLPEAIGWWFIDKLHKDVYRSDIVNLLLRKFTNNFCYENSDTMDEPEVCNFNNATFKKWMESFQHMHSQICQVCEEYGDQIKYLATNAGQYKVFTCHVLTMATSLICQANTDTDTDNEFRIDLKKVRKVLMDTNPHHVCQVKGEKCILPDETTWNIDNLRAIGTKPAIKYTLPMVFHTSERTNDTKIKISNICCMTVNLDKEIVDSG